MTDDDRNPIELGFAEECDEEPWLLTNRYFPSKIGGKPAWLELENLPRIDDLTCKECKQPCVFLCQVYAPIESKDECFHRTIFLFICRNEACCVPNENKNILVLRSQLARENEFYEPIAPDETQELEPVEPRVPLCNLCGCQGPLVCSNCKKASYCCKDHQVFDWKIGHKKICKGNNYTKRFDKKYLYPEFEIVIEAEPKQETADENDTQQMEEQRLQQYEELVKSGKAGSMNVSEKDLEQYATGSDEDKQFHRFKKRIACSQEQVLRYQRGGKPLWITSKPNYDEKTVPNCEYCGSPRIFEFQIMPQLLNYIKEEKLDWGVVATYTCTESCDTKGGYLREYALKQDIINEETINNSHAES